MRYCYWRIEKNSDGKQIKKPYGWDEFQGIVSTGWQSALLPTLAEAEACRPKGYRIGFYIEPPYCAIDLDDCFDAEGKPNENVASILDRALKLSCYNEKSQSGNGMHVIGSLREGITLPAHKNRTGLEVYTDGRFFAATNPEMSEFCDVDITELATTICTELLRLDTIPSERSLTKPTIDVKTFDAAVAALRKQSPDDSYENWMRSITSMANSFSGTQFEAPALREVVAWSKRSSKYDTQAILHIRRYFAEARTRSVSQRPRTTIATLFAEHPECIPKIEVNLQEEFDVVLAEPAAAARETVNLYSDTQSSTVNLYSDTKELGMYSYVHDVGIVVRQFRDQGIFSIGGKEFFQHDGQKWEMVANDFNYLLRMAKEFITARGYNWYRGKGGMAIVEVDCVKGHGVLAQALRECLAVKNAFPLNSWMSPTAPSGEQGGANYLPVQNGILEITKTGSRLLEPNTGFFNLSVSETQYLGDCSVVGHPKQLEQGLLRTFGGEKAAVEMWYNILGLALLNRVFAKKLILVQGASDAGKGQLTELLALLVGETAYTTTNEVTLTGNFAFADLDRAAVCVIDELDTSYMNKALRNALKTLTSGGSVAMNQKMVRQRNGYVTAKVVITTNDTIEALRDPHGGLRQRLVCFNVSKVQASERVYNWARIVWQQEGPQILALAVARAELILRQGVGIIETPEGSSRLLMQEIEEVSVDPIVHWLRNKYTFAANAERGLPVMSILAGYLATEHERSSEHKYWMSQSKVWQGRNAAKKIVEAFPSVVIKQQKSGAKVYGLVEILEFVEDERG